MLYDIDRHEQLEFNGEIYDLGERIILEFASGPVKGRITDITRNHFWVESDSDRYQINIQTGKTLKL
jgi:hypothetical protein